MLYQRKIHFPFEKKIEIGSKWIEVWNQSGEKTDPYQALCGKVSNVTHLITYLEISDARYPEITRLGIVTSDFLSRFKEV